MEDSGSTIDLLALQLLEIAREKRTGTLTVTSPDEAVRHVVFVLGNVADVDTGRTDGVLEAALVGTGLYGERDLKRARKTSSKKDVSLGAALLELEVAPEDVVVESVQHQVVDEVCALFAQDVDEIAFTDHSEDERIETFYSDLTDHLELFIDGEELFLEGVSRGDRWDLVEQSFDVLRDVYYATPSSFKYFKEQDVYPEEHSLVGAVDGVKDIEEVVQTSDLDPFTAIRVVRRLIDCGELELVNPVQMYQLGVEAGAEGNQAKACRLFLRAHERGLDDFDLQLKLAQLYEALGDRASALHWFLHFADKCEEQLRIEDAIRSLKKATRIEPENNEIRERYLSLLFEHNRRDEAIDELNELASKMAAQGNVREALDLLKTHQGDDEKDTKLQQKVIELAERAGDQKLVATEREALARNLDLRKDVEAALEVYQKMYCDGDDSLDVRLKLVELHRKSGNRQKAIDHIGALLGLPRKRAVQDRDTLLMLHEAVIELKPSDQRSNQWLVDHYVRTEQEERAKALLVQWIAHLDREGELEDLELAYQQLLNIDDRSDHRWGLASTLEKLGREAEAHRELRSLANLSLRRKEYDQAQRALEHIVKNSPFDIESRKMQAELLEAKGDRHLAVEKCKEVALLDVMAGNVQEAEQFCRQILVMRPDDAEMVTKLGQLCHASGDARKAAEQFLKAAKIHYENQNFGLCRAAVEQLLAVDPSQQEAKGLLDKIETRLNPPAPVAPAASSPRAASKAAEPRADTSSAASQAPEREMFQHAPPVTTSVARSMARLKKLKTAGMGGSGGSSSAAPPPKSSGGTARTATVKVSDITAKLRSLKGGGSSSPPPAPAPTPAAAAASEPEPAETPTLAPETSAAIAAKEDEIARALGVERSEDKSQIKIPSTSAALQAAASRLRALASGGADDAGAKADSPAEGDPSVDESSADQASAEDPSSAAAEAAPSTESAPSAPSAQEKEKADAETVKKLKLGSAASRLAALRGAKAAAAAKQQEPEGVEELESNPS